MDRLLLEFLFTVCRCEWCGFVWTRARSRPESKSSHLIERRHPCRCQTVPLPRSVVPAKCDCRGRDPCGDQARQRERQDWTRRLELRVREDFSLEDSARELDSLSTHCFQNGMNRTCERCLSRSTYVFFWHRSAVLLRGCSLEHHFLSFSRRSKLFL